MPTGTQNAVVGALMQSIVVALPLWIAVLRYVTKIGITQEDVINEEDDELYHFTLEIYSKFQRHRGIAIGFVAAVLSFIVLAGLLTIAYLSQTGTIEAAGLASINPFPPKKTLGYALTIMLAIMPVQFTLLLIYASILQTRANSFRHSVNRIRKLR